MKQTVTTGIVLSRTNFGEADRIVTMLTPDYGKIRGLAKGVRKVKSKLAGGIELFSVSDISFIKGRGEVSTITSTRLKTHYGNIVKDVNRTMFGYELLKIINRSTEDNVGEEYFILLKNGLAGLNDDKLNQQLIELWLYMQLLKLGGHSPNLKTGVEGSKLSDKQKYTFDFDKMAFAVHSAGQYDAKYIKLLRLAIGLDSPLALQKLQDADKVLGQCSQLAKAMLGQYIRL